MVGGGHCILLDTYWQTETGSHLLTPMVAMTCKPGSAGLPFFGVDVAILDENGMELQGECEGRLVLKRPMPSMLRSIYGDPKRFEESYFSQVPGYYFTGDGCRRRLTVLSSFEIFQLQCAPRSSHLRSISKTCFPTAPRKVHRN